MSGGYGSGTSVSIENSMRAIRKMLMSKIGARQIQIGDDLDAGTATVMFKYKHFIYKIVIFLPDPDADEYWKTPSRRQKRTKEQAFKAWEQAARQRWRSIWLRIRCLADLIEMNDFKAVDQMLLGYIMLPGNQTAFEYYTPQLEKAYETGDMPKQLLPGENE